MNTPSSESDGLLIPHVAWAISQEAGRIVSSDSITKAAKRIGVLRKDAAGRNRLPRAAAEKMKLTYMTTGYLVSRGQRALTK